MVYHWAMFHVNFSLISNIHIFSELEITKVSSFEHKVLWQRDKSLSSWYYGWRSLPTKNIKTVYILHAASSSAVHHTTDLSLDVCMEVTWYSSVQDMKQQETSTHPEGSLTVVHDSSWRQRLNKSRTHTHVELQRKNTCPMMPVFLWVTRSWFQRILGFSFTIEPRG